MLGLPISLRDMKLALKLKGLLKDRGTTVTNLAKATQVPKQTIHNWCAGAKPKDFDQVKRVADYFEVSLDELIYGTERKIAASPIVEMKDEINAGVFEVVLRRIKK